MRFALRLWILTLLTGGAGCAASTPLAPPGLEGVWQTDGYGYLLVAAGDTVNAFEVTRATCVHSFTAVRRPTAGSGVEARYETDGEAFQVFSLTAGAGPDEKHFQIDWTASYITIRRVPNRPAICDQPTPDTPEGNFEVFANTWAEHYILFDQKGVDWAKVVADARPGVTPSTTPEQLFDVMEGMIARFEDAHTMIVADPIKRRFHAFRKGTDRVVKGDIPEFQKNGIGAILRVTDRKLIGPVHGFCNDQLQYGHVDDSTGYLRILSENGYTREGGFAAGLAALEAALDTVFSDSKLTGLVIDTRINFGGSDPYGLALASRLATSEYVAYAKEARLDPVDRTRWTPGQASVVRLSPRPGFTGPVVELIGPLTISAGETTTQALMGRTPRILRIGEPTQGVFSDILGRRLPNGWFFGLPNEVFRTADGQTFDGPGIPPDITVPVFADADIAAGRDPGLDRAAAELRKAR